MIMPLNSHHSTNSMTKMLLGPVGYDALAYELEMMKGNR